MARIGIDVGGTHTDGVLIDNNTIVKKTKVLTTHNNLQKSIEEVIDDLLKNYSTEKIKKITLSTTLTTILILEKKLQDGLIKLDLVVTKTNITITIEDNGGGVPEKILPKIFEPYFTTKHQSQGTGLGLHMSHRIITESMNGKLYVRNINDGAKFFIELPLNS